MYFKTSPDYSYKPYFTLGSNQSTLPSIIRLAPSERSITLEWLDPISPDATEAYVYYSLDTKKYNKIEINSRSVEIPFPENSEGILYVEAKDGRKSPSRNFRTGFYPGRVVNYLHPSDTRYVFSGKHLASPSILRLDNGDLLALMDVFASGYPMTLSILYRSQDNGETWEYVTDITPCAWGTLFKNGGKAYIFCVSREYGDLQVLESLDNGESWHGIVLGRGLGLGNMGYHMAPVPVVHSNGKIFVATEYGCWQKKRFYPMIWSASEDSDLMDASSWSSTEPFDVSAKLDGISPDRVGIAIEGNAVAFDGKIYNIMRHGKGRALKLSLDLDRSKLSFDEFFDFDLGFSKFFIREHNGTYYAMGNLSPYRNELVLYKSENLTDWSYVKHVVDLKSEAPNLVGCQYPSFFIEGNTAYVLARTAINGAVNYHDSNAITFHKIKLS